MVLGVLAASIRTVARISAAVLFALALAPVSARAIPMPDSAGFARLERMAGPSGRAELRVLWRAEWLELRGASYDSTGVRGGERETSTGGITSVWAVRDSTTIPWAEVERLRVPGARGRPVGAIVGASVFGLIGLSAIAAASTEYQMSAGTGILVESVFLISGAAIGALLHGLNPWRKPTWVDF